MKCPYCSGDSNFENASLTYKYTHKECEKKFKFCRVCNSYHIEKTDKYTNEDAIVTDNLFDVDSCSCGTWLPDFPTSWIRSITNLEKLWELLNDISDNDNNFINSENLFEIQRNHFGVIYNPKRARLRGIETYISGAPKRRMNEYINILKNMGMIRQRNDKNSELTRFGQEAINTDNDKAVWSYLILAYMNLKLTNGYQKESKSSCYTYFNIRFMHNILRVLKYINDKGNAASKYQLGLAVLCRNENEYKKYCIKYIDCYTDKNIKAFFFENDDELNRAVVSSFLNVFISLKLIKIDDKKLYSITELGKGVLNILDNTVPIWWDDIVKYSEKNNQDIYEVSSKILIYRLLKNNLISKEDINLSEEDINRTVENIVNKDIDSIRDIHFNLYYDEPKLYKGDNIHTTKILNSIKGYFKDGSSIELDDVSELCSVLNYSWYKDIRDCIDLHGGKSLFNIKKDTRLQAGRAWHDKSVKLLQELGLNVSNYQDRPIFRELEIDKLELMLPGGTVHNPDILVFEDGIGKKSCILVDAKDQNSINSEVPKLMGYSLYARDKRIDSYSIITLRGKLPNKTRSRIESSLDEFERVTLIEEEALEYLATLCYNKEKYLDILLANKGFKYISKEHLKNIKL